MTYTYKFGISMLSRAKGLYPHHQHVNRRQCEEPGSEVITLLEMLCPVSSV